MKKTINLVLLFTLLSSFISQKSDDHTVHVIYKIGEYKDNNSASNFNKLNAEMKQMSIDFEKAIEITEMDLYCNKTKSIFKKTDGLNQDAFANHFIDAYIGGLFFYKDLDLKEKITQNEFSGEKFNVIENFDEYNWEITSETKEINGFKCFKAIAHTSSFSKFRKKNIDFDINVWFAPSIPYSFGPRGIDGLPGLVLEGSLNGKIYFYASTIDLDYKDKKIDFEKPKNGKYVTKEELENIQVKLLNQD